STDNYKSTNKLIHLLLDIVAKGGNFLLNVGPDADGNLPPTALDRMREIGEWMGSNGQGIYSTRPIYPYSYEKLRFTKGKNGDVYAFYLLDEGEKLPSEIKLPSDLSIKTGKVAVLGANKKVSLTKDKDSYLLKGLDGISAKHAVCFVCKTF
ncbi:MAG: alpha-L-fucosidase, partial [Bacteroidales bacterium]|nr:alpha-L-fucosidase [Bacteroidales bacterium]